MNLNEYQAIAIGTAIYPGQGTIQGLVYAALKMNGEAGEVAEAVGKALRDDDSVITPEKRMKLIWELGDVLWYISAAAKELDCTLDDVAAANIVKVLDRRARGVTKGSGDVR